MNTTSQGLIVENLIRLGANFHLARGYLNRLIRFWIRSLKVNVTVHLVVEKLAQIKVIDELIKVS